MFDKEFDYILKLKLKRIWIWLTQKIQELAFILTKFDGFFYVSKYKLWKYDWLKTENWIRSLAQI
jgi:hypothetical protein